MGVKGGKWVDGGEKGIVYNVACCIANGSVIMVGRHGGERGVYPFHTVPLDTLYYHSKSDRIIPYT